jgi:FAD/FMN-containing dehydrogenase
MGALGVLSSLRSQSFALEGKAPVSTGIPGLTGKVIRKKDRNYELWRQSMIWHASKPERYPDMIVQAHSEDDVIGAVRYAAEHGHKVSIRSGGHNSTGCSLRDGGMVLDLSSMDDIVIDEAAQLAYVQPGARSIQLIGEARKKGLTFPVPHCPSVGLSGFTMGGGIGLNYPQYGGMATFSIAGAEIVTAQGEKVLATADQNPDLYWAVRGAGPGFFGVVTRLQLRLYPAPKAIMSSSYIFPIGDMDKALPEIGKLMKNKDIHDRVEVLSILMHHPEAPDDAPPEESKIFFVNAFAFEDTESDALALLAHFSKSGLASKAAVKMENQSLGYDGLYDKYFSLEDPAGRMGRYKVNNVLTHRGSDALLALKDYFLKAPSRDCHILGAWGMKLQERHKDACFSGLGDCFIGVYSIWDHPQGDEAGYAWLREARALIDPLADGIYINEIDGEGEPDRYQRAFTPANWERLQKLRKQYDPNGVFHSYLGHS